jgi:hypothetical protein
MKYVNLFFIVFNLVLGISGILSDDVISVVIGCYGISSALQGIRHEEILNQIKGEDNE